MSDRPVPAKTQWARTYVVSVSGPLALRTARNDARLSQVELGQRVGRDHKTIHRYETATSIPTLVDLLLIANALGVRASRLVD